VIFLRMSHPSVIVLGSGNGGATEMQQHVDANKVCWAVCQLDVGRGSFARRKVLFLHLNGEACPPLRRGRTNQHTRAVLERLRRNSALGCFHASVEICTPAEVSSDALLQRVQPFFMADDLGDYSIEKVLNHLQQNASLKNLTSSMVDCCRLAGLEISSHLGVSRAVSNCPFTKGHDALRAVAQPSGCWDWVLLQPDKKSFALLSAGGGAINEMRHCLSLHSSSVLFGLLRICFGTGRLQRTKYVFIHAVGENVSALKRGKSAAMRSHVRQEVAKFVDCSITLEISRSTDLTWEAVMQKVRSAVAVDESLLGHETAEGAKGIHSVEALLTALERKDGCSGEAQHSKQGLVNQVGLSVDDAVRMVSTPSAELNWALFGLADKSVQSSHIGTAASSQPVAPKHPCSSLQHDKHRPLQVSKVVQRAPHKSSHSRHRAMRGGA